MRPVDRGSTSQSFSNYRDAYEPLVARIGRYCSYCERKIETHLAIEHICPKAYGPNAALVNDWSNFLLACVNCNSCKGQATITTAKLDDYLWPDCDNTVRVFRYDQALVTIQPGLPPAIMPKSENIRKLVGLDKDPGQVDPERKPTREDKRWLFRNETWGIATRSLARLRSGDSTELREQIIETAESRGGFSIWYAVFMGDPDMRQRLVEAFPGTAHDAFDGNYLPIKRVGGQY